MKSRNYVLIAAVIAAVFFSSCNQKPAPLGNGTSSGTSLQDTILPKMLFKLVHEGGSYYLAYYWVSAMVVDTTTSPPKLTMAAQSALYSSTSSSSVLHNGFSTSQISSAVSVNTDTVTAVSAGPFDMVDGYLYSTKGYLHYCNKTTGDTCLCPVAEVVYYNQSGAGKPMLIGYINQNDLHAPKPPSQ